MLERTIIVPDRDNAGVSLARERHSIERELLALAGGYTRERVSGAWLEHGRVYRNTSARFTVAVTPEQDAAIAARLPVWCARLRQLSLYTHTRPVEVAFVTGAA